MFRIQKSRTITAIGGSAHARSMLDLKHKSRELEKNLPVTVKNFHNLELRGILGIGHVEEREIG